MSWYCKYCNKFLSSQYSMKRHIDHMHGDEEDESEVESTETEEDISDTENEGSINESDAESSIVSEEYISKGWQNPFWKHLLCSAYSQISEIPNELDDIIMEPYFSKMSHLMKKLYDYYAYMYRAKHCSKIQDRLDNLFGHFSSTMNLDDDEAEDMAWSASSHLFKKYILKNEEVFNKEWQSRK